MYFPAHSFQEEHTAIYEALSRGQKSVMKWDSMTFLQWTCVDFVINTK